VWDRGDEVANHANAQAHCQSRRISTAPPILEIQHPGIISGLVAAILGLQVISGA